MPQRNPSAPPAPAAPAVTFRARARTVDHLGREQIADCPTAISELWKNAFDAYARRVELNLYDTPQPVAAVTDDGHGMNREDFVQRWLVVGTESKVAAPPVPVADRNGLPVRPRQGQKGIGRLSCANLGPILLLISKRIHHPFVVALLDWRLFENPFLDLSDILIPVAEFSTADDLPRQLPRLITRLSENLTGGTEPQRAARIRHAWTQSDSLRLATRNHPAAPSLPSAAEIRSQIAELPFHSRHLHHWPVWTGDSQHGTALLISDLNYDLTIHLADELPDASARAASARFFETLVNFVDPFVDRAHAAAATHALHFSYLARAWKNGSSREIVGTHKQFDKHLLDRMEHRIDGRVDNHGVFSGHVRAFGDSLSGLCTIHPPSDLRVPHQRAAELGPFSIYIASMEFLSTNTTHSPEEFQQYKQLAERYSGFMVFRDGLRVLPYGRTDNDFFDIESRRSKSAGREFWNHRQMFGRLSITRRHNPNLTDKAGREGLLDNRAAKTLKALVSNILKQSARRYFGSEAQIRKDLLPYIAADNRRKRAADARRRLRQKHRRAFRTKLNRYSRELPHFAHDVDSYAQALDITTPSQIPETYRALAEFQDRLADYDIVDAPKDLGPLEDQYCDYRRNFGLLGDALAALTANVGRQVDQLQPPDPLPLLRKQLNFQADIVQDRLRTWKRSIDTLLKAERQRIDRLTQHRRRHFHAEAEPLLRRFAAGDLTYARVAELLELLRRRTDSDNAAFFLPYIGALETLSDSIDLEHLAIFDMEELGTLTGELDRLNSLAQLGIAVEILGHELQSYDDMIADGLSRLPSAATRTSAAKDIQTGYEGLTDQLRFLSPLRLAGPKIQRWVSGSDVADYVQRFFSALLARNKTTLTATGGFRAFRVFDQASRLYPVFINLVNNSLYWLSMTGDDRPRQIIFDAKDVDVVVSDNGPGVEADDVDRLFQLFFTKKTSGGRGVGLYLCRANLAAGGHLIRYEPDSTGMPLPGANFVISFRGAEFDGQ